MLIIRWCSATVDRDMPAADDTILFLFATTGTNSPWIFYVHTRDFYRTLWITVLTWTIYIFHKFYIFVVQRCSACLRDHFIIQFFNCPILYSKLLSSGISWLKCVKNATYVTTKSTVMFKRDCHWLDTWKGRIKFTNRLKSVSVAWFASCGCRLKTGQEYTFTKIITDAYLFCCYFNIVTASSECAFNSRNC
jgi:hypothetical protein